MAESSVRAPESGVLTFTKPGDVVDMGKRPEHKIQRDITMEAWVYATSRLRWAGIISRIFDTSTNESGYCLTLDDGTGIFCGIKTANGPVNDFYYSTGPNTLSLDEWHHVAATYDGKQIVIYIDGEEKKRVPCTGDISYNPDNNLTIGAYRDDNENIVFPGKIAEVRLWSVARTPQQIKAAMNVALRGDEAGLAGYWRVDEGSGDTVKDHSKNAVDGTRAGAIWSKAAVPFGQKAPEAASGSPSGDWDQARRDLEKKIADLAEQAKKCGACDEKIAALESRLAEQERARAEQDRRLAELAAKAEKCGACDEKIAAQAQTIEGLTTRLDDLAKKLADASAKPAAVVPVTPPPVTPPPPVQPAVPDDLESIEGIGPKLLELLNGEGIATYRDLAATSVAALKKILKAGGTKFARNDPSSWPEQARLMLEGKTKELKALQDSLRGGRAKA